MKKSTRIFAVLLCGLVFFVVFLVVVSTLPVTVVYRKEVKEVNAAVGLIECRRRTTGRLPDESELGIKSRKIFYFPYEDGGYEIGISVNFDEDYYFDHDTGKWSRGPGGE